MILHETIIYMGPQVEQELLTLPEHLCSILWIIVFILSFLLLAITLSVLFDECGI